jgi:hypothetical protein
MNTDIGAIRRFTRCPHLYFLHDVEKVPLVPNLKMVLGRVVKLCIDTMIMWRNQSILGDVFALARDVTEGVFQKDIAYTDAEAARGVRYHLTVIGQQAGALASLWRGAIQRQLHTPCEVNVPFERTIGHHVVSGFADIKELSQTRSTSVRSRRPDDRAAPDPTLIIIADAGGRHQLDFLVSTNPPGVRRIVYEFTSEHWQQTIDRLDVMERAVERGVYAPTDPQNWKCAGCLLRSVCRYVSA